MTERKRVSPHPLDECDDDECYKTMMAERTVLVAAQREAQDNLIKTVIQLSSALIALTAGFVTQASIQIVGTSFFLFSAAIGGLTLAVVCGLVENFYSSRAYKEQQIALEEYYGKFTIEFGEAPSNRLVRRAQVGAFLFFVLALLGLASFAVVQAKGKGDVKKSATSAALPSSVAGPREFWRQSVRVCDEIRCTEYATSTSEEGRLIR